MMKSLRALAIGAATTALIFATSLSGGGAQAASLTPWSNPYVGFASVRGADYRVKFIGTGAHVYESVKSDGCERKLARRYTVTVYKASQPSKVLYRATLDATHVAYATKPFNTDIVKYPSASALIKAVNARVHTSAEVVAWRSGGKELAQWRALSLASDIGWAMDAVTTYTKAQAKKIFAAKGANVDEGYTYYGDYMKDVPLDGFDIGAHMRSTKALYGTGCGRGGTAQFKRSVSVTGVGGSYTVIDTNATDGLTIGYESATKRSFRLVGGQRTFYKDAYAAVEGFWKQLAPPGA